MTFDVFSRAVSIVAFASIALSGFSLGCAKKSGAADGGAGQPGSPAASGPDGNNLTPDGSDGNGNTVTGCIANAYCGSNGAATHAFGSSVALNGGYFVVGAPGYLLNKGTAYVFERQNDGTWPEKAKLQGDGSGGFGASVAMDGDNIVVGASRDDNPKGNDAGSVYVFNSW